MKYENLFNKTYLTYWNFAEKAGYAGTCIMTKFLPLNVTNGIGISKHDNEGRTITLEFDSFFLVTCYVPNAGEGLKRLSYRTKEWDLEFRAYLEGLRKKKDVILCGDLNVAHHDIDISNPKGNLKSPGFTVEERSEFTKFLNLGYVDTFREKYPSLVKYSFWSARSNARETNKGWRLDYFIINKEAGKRCLDSEILNDYHGSDHCPIKLRFNS